jgi:hypothetical protein
MTTSRITILATAALLAGIGAATLSAAPLSAGESVAAAGAEFSSQARQRPRVRVTPDRPAAYDFPLPGPYAPPGPGYVRQCVDWYATEYRMSGVVVTPQMRCRWVRG